MNKVISVFFVILFSFIQIQAYIKTDPALPSAVTTSVFVDQNEFYVGTAEGSGAQSISSLQISNDTATFVGKASAYGVTVNGKINQSSTMNNVQVTQLASTSIPISNQQNAQKYLVAARSTESAESPPDTSNSIAWIDLSGQTKTEFANTNQINDASGARINKKIVALAASTDIVFVAVAPAELDKVFGAENSGIVRLRKTNSVTDGLKVQPLSGTGNFGDNEKAYKLDLTALKNYEKALDPGSSVKFAASSGQNEVKFTLGSAADFWWDEKLQRLYLGLVNAIGDKASDAAPCTLLVGRMEGSVLKFRTAVSIEGHKDSKENAAVINLDSDDLNYMIACYAKQANTKSVSTFKVRTMHTSTGKDYAITVGDVVDLGEANPDLNKYLTTQVNVYALPLVGSASDQSINGMIAKKDTSKAGGIDFTARVQKTNTMLSKSTDKAQVTVGVDAACLAITSSDVAKTAAAITDIQVVGDTVYISNAGKRGIAEDASEAGIFSSTSIFNEYGVVRAWTPWQRAMGIAEQVYNFGLDKNTNSFWYITDASPGAADKTLGKVTIWSSGATSVHPAGTLWSVLKSDFDDDFGIFNIVNFDDETPSFKMKETESFYPYFSMMVATGFSKVALVQTGGQESEIFKPTQDFASGTNVFTFTLDANNAITCAEVSRATDGNKGWLFIGGSAGVLVLSQKDGTGWDCDEGLSSLSATDFPGTGYSFKIINPGTENLFSNVRKLICDGTYLYVLTSKKFYRLKMDAKYFRGRANLVFDQSDFTVLASAATYGEFFDAIQIQLDSATPKLSSMFVLATNQGLGVLDSSQPNSIKYDFIKDTQSTPAAFTSGPAVKLDFISAKRGGRFDIASVSVDSNKKIDVTAFANGNLYVTAFDSQMNGLFCYRFNVQYYAPTQTQTTTTTAAVTPGMKITLFAEPYDESGVTQKYFYRIVDLSKMERPIYINRNTDLNMQSSQFAGSIGMSPDPDKFLSKEQIDFGYPPNRIPAFGSVIRDTGSGALYIPGDFGLVVCE